MALVADFVHFMKAQAQCRHMAGFVCLSLMRRTGKGKGNGNIVRVAMNNDARSFDDLMDTTKASA